MADNRFAPKRTLSGNFAANPRVFAHDAINLTPSGTLDTSDIVNTDQPFRGACLYIGAAMTSVSVIMESGNAAVFKGLAAGSFLPILVKSVSAASPSGGSLSDNDILALL